MKESIYTSNEVIIRPDIKDNLAGQSKREFIPELYFIASG